MNATVNIGPRQYTVAEAAIYLKLHSQSVYDLVARNLLTSRRKGVKSGRIYFLQTDLDEYIEGKTPQNNRRMR